MRSLRELLMASGQAPRTPAVAGEPKPVDGTTAMMEWAASGGMHLTGWPAMAPLAGGASMLAAAREVVDLCRDMGGDPLDLDVDEVLFGRAALARSTRAGRRSAGRSCRLLRTADSWVAVNLARPTDIDAVPAIVERHDPRRDAWRALARHARTRTADDVAARCQLLAVPAAALHSAATLSPQPIVVRRLGPARPRPPAPLVVDLSALWAGPLCARVLAGAGARVVKVESADRLDGARRGNPAFYRWLHAGHASVVIDFASPAGRESLAVLVGSADIVIEGSRARALRRLGIEAEQVVAETGATWLSITGYGRDRDLVAFGDDAAVAGGLVAFDASGQPVFCGDAIADPLTGIYAAAACLAVEGGSLVSVAMAGVARHAHERGRTLVTPCSEVGVVASRPGEWEARIGTTLVPVRRPRPPSARVRRVV